VYCVLMVVYRFNIALIIIMMVELGVRGMIG